MLKINQSPPRDTSPDTKVTLHPALRLNAGAGLHCHHKPTGDTGMNVYIREVATPHACPFF